MNQSTFISKAKSVLKDNAGVRKLPHQRHGKFLDEAHLGLVRAGETRIFQKSIKRQFFDYHVCIVMDCSGSMGGEKIEYAVYSTHALAHALKQAGAKVDVFTFNRLYKKIDESIYGDPKVFYHQGLKEVDGWQGGGNHDHYAVEMTRQFMMKENRPGKIMLVISDGEPICGSCKEKGCIPEGVRDLYEIALKKAIKNSRNSGISTLAIGIMSEAARRFYGERQSRIIGNLDSLYSEMAGLLEKNIVRG